MYFNCKTQTINEQKQQPIRITKIGYENRHIDEIIIQGLRGSIVSG